jgi:hypothetical protein
MLMLLVASGMLVTPGKFSFPCASRYSLGFFMPSFTSSFIFNPSLFSIQIHGESSLECAITSYSHGLSLLCQVPVPVNDPMAFVPKEVDYYEGSVLPFPSKAFGTYRG